MTAPIIKGRTAIWGVKPGAQDTHVAAIITKMGHKKAGSEDFIYDGDGCTITEIFYDDIDEVSVDVICETATAMPARGDAVTINSIAAIVQTAELIWEQKAWKKLNITAKKFINLSLT